VRNFYAFDFVFSVIHLNLKGGKIGKDMPYEVPLNPDLTIDSTEESLLASLDKIIKSIGKLAGISNISSR
jgi:hypothetical protein